MKDVNPKKVRFKRNMFGGSYTLHVSSSVALFSTRLCSILGITFLVSTLWFSNLKGLVLVITFAIFASYTSEKKYRFEEGFWALEVFGTHF